LTISRFDWIGFLNVIHYIRILVYSKQRCLWGFRESHYHLILRLRIHERSSLLNFILRSELEILLSKLNILLIDLRHNLARMFGFLRRESLTGVNFILVHYRLNSFVWAFLCFSFLTILSSIVHIQSSSCILRISEHFIILCDVLLLLMRVKDNRILGHSLLVIHIFNFICT
jgi:hypothetical protein